MGSTPPYELSRVDRVQQMAEEIINSKTPLTINDLAINGHDLMKIGYAPGTEMGQTLRALMDIVLQDPEENRNPLYRPPDERYGACAGSWWR
jgi:tRNA nucleotidyltransferase (CCA-adding enzyme)